MSRAGRKPGRFLCRCTGAAGAFSGLMVLCVAVLPGCSSGTIQFVSLNMSEIDPPPAKLWKFDAQESFWWKDPSGELCISLRHQQRSLLLGKLGAVDLGVAFVFDTAPAGRARNYSVRQKEVRAVYSSALANQRFLPVTGIVAVVIGKDGVMRGSYRVWMTPLAELSLFSVLPQRPGSVLCFGTFEARPDARRGLEIRRFCEAGDPLGPARTTTRPVTTQPTTVRSE